MSKRIYLSENTIRCYDNFTLTCTKGFDNTFFTDDYTLVDDEEYFDAEFESLEVLENSYESKIAELNDKIADLEAKFAESEEFTQGYRKECAKIQSENIQLKQQLEESEKKNFELIAKLNLKEHKPAFCTLADRECEALGQVEQLKQQLEESESYIQGNIPKLVEANKMMSKQLEEKDAELESLKNNWNILCDYLGECVVKYDEEDINGIYGEVLDKVNEFKRYDYKRHQDKISFAVEQLELLKHHVRLDNSDEETGDMPYVVDTTCLFELIDNQIKQLKEMK